MYAFRIFHNNSWLLELQGGMVSLSMRYCYVIILMCLVPGLSQTVNLIVNYFGKSLPNTTTSL